MRQWLVSFWLRLCPGALPYRLDYGRDIFQDRLKVGPATDRAAGARRSPSLFFLVQAHTEERGACARLSPTDNRDRSSTRGSASLPWGVALVLVDGVRADVQDVKRIPTRSGNTRFVLVDNQGREFTTFREDVAVRLHGLEGKRARIQYHEEHRGNFTNVYLDPRRAARFTRRRRAR